MSDIKELYDLYDSYIRKVEEIQRNKKITDGLFGLTKGPKDDPCHDLFIKAFEEKISDFKKEDLSSRDAYTLLDYIYSEPLKHRDNNMIYWMFCAVHTLAYDLIPVLDSPDAEKLYQKYQDDYPRQERLPAQKKTLKALKARAHSNSFNH